MLSGSSSCRVASRSSGYSYLKVTTWRYPSSLETARWIGRTLLTSSRWYRWILRYTIGRSKCGSTPTLAHELGETRTCSFASKVEDETVEAAAIWLQGLQYRIR